MDSSSHKAYHVDEYIPRDTVKASSSSPFATSAYGKSSAMYNNHNEGRPAGNSMYVMVPVPVPMAGPGQHGGAGGGYGWNGASFPVNHPSDWDSGHASSSRAALMPHRRPSHTYRGYHHRKNCCSCWRCAVASVIILAFIGIGIAVAGIVFLKMMRENAEPTIVTAGAVNGTRSGSSTGNGDATAFDITLVAPTNNTVVVTSSGNTSPSDGHAVALMDFLDDGASRVSSADVDLRSADGSANAIGIIVPPNTNLTVNVTNDAAVPTGQSMEQGVAVEVAPTPASSRTVGAGTTGLMSFVRSPSRTSANGRAYDLTVVPASSGSSSTGQMPPTPGPGMSFTVDDPEVIGASSAHLFSTSPAPSHLIPMMIISVENGTMGTNGRLDVPNPVSAVTHSPSEARNTTFLGARAFHHAQLETSSTKPAKKPQ